MAIGKECTPESGWPGFVEADIPLDDMHALLGPDTEAEILERIKEQDPSGNNRSRILRASGYSAMQGIAPDS